MRMPSLVLLGVVAVLGCGPIGLQHLQLAKTQGARIIAIDPRRTETAMAATQHVALRPKSDLVLLYGIGRALIERGDLSGEASASSR